MKTTKYIVYYTTINPYKHRTRTFNKLDSAVKALDEEKAWTLKCLKNEDEEQVEGRIKPLMWDEFLNGGRDFFIEQVITDTTRLDY